MDVNDIPDGVQSRTILMFRQFSSIRSIGSLHAFGQYFVFHNLIFLSIGSARLMSTRSPSLMKVVMSCTLEVMTISVRSVFLLIYLDRRLVLSIFYLASVQPSINYILVYLLKNITNIGFVYNRCNCVAGLKDLMAPYAPNSFENGRIECLSFRFCYKSKQMKGMLGQPFRNAISLLSDLRLA
jgi:hypothetical protein